MNEIRCGQCSKKLAEGVYLKLTIKCARCRAINHFEGQEPPTRTPWSVRPEDTHGNQRPTKQTVI